MATTFLKLGLKKIDEVKHIMFNNQDIEIRQYLPINEKIQLITEVMSNSIDDKGFVNQVKAEVFFDLGLFYYYTNINFTDKQKEDPSKLFDLLEENGLISMLKDNINDHEYYQLYNFLEETIRHYSDYKMSALGILEAATTDYSNLNFDASEIQEKIADPNNLTLLKDVMDKLG